METVGPLGVVGLKSVLSAAHPRLGDLGCALDVKRSGTVAKTASTTTVIKLCDECETALTDVCCYCCDKNWIL